MYWFAGPPASEHDADPASAGILIQAAVIDALDLSAFATDDGSIASSLPDDTRWLGGPAAVGDAVVRLVVEYVVHRCRRRNVATLRPY
jgi:hypothetical protein